MKNLTKQDSGSTFESGTESHTDSEQLDAPRIAQWIDEEDLERASSDTQSEEEDSAFATIKRDISKLPLETLVKAHKAIKTTARDSDDESEPSDLESEVEHHDEQDAGANLPTRKERRPIQHRSSKHAPMEVTSKKPVPRRRQVVEVHPIRPRDPRFSDVSGSLSIDRFRSNYDFLPSLHTTELSTLKQSLARARKLLISSPRDLRQEREEEVHRLEQAVKRAESIVNRERREEAERQALSKLHKEEKEKRISGKKAWWMKDADKKAVRVRARMDAIAATGGKRAVKKAIEKKQRKVGQKEKKSRPFGPKAAGAGKRSRSEGDGNERAVKRPRV
ncbi:hypothetical protein JB92DRAFT_2890686 [Gautieria morchelliformis]|nr:hypothetical protein JB92DRAFT_2890686 [Gautieria morchelliformis]